MPTLWCFYLLLPRAGDGGFKCSICGATFTTPLGLAAYMIDHVRGKV